MYFQDFSEWTFPRFLQGPYLKAALTMLPQNAKQIVRIMVPYLIQGEILHAILSLRDQLRVEILTRDHSGYLPNIKSGAQPAIRQLHSRPNVSIYINNDIHAKMWVIDDTFVVIHSMNGTPRSEVSNYEAGIVAIQADIIKESTEYFEFVKRNCVKLSK